MEVVARNSSPKYGKRILSFDCIRCICVFWVIAFWHLGDYVEIRGRDSLEYVTIGVLGMFSVLSGYLVGHKNVSIMNFYLARLKRFLIPLFIAAFLFRLSGYYVIENVFLVVSGLDMFFPPASMTLWYFSMLIVLYALTPLLSIESKNGTKVIIIERTIIAIIIYLVFFVLYWLGHLDVRMLIYYPCYVLGIYSSVEYLTKYQIFYLLGAIGCVFVDLLIGQIFFISIMWIRAFGVFLLLLFLGNILPKLGGGYLYRKIAYASMFAYIFHRPLYYLMFKMPFPICYDKIYILGCILVVFIVSYYLQRYYDKFLGLFIRKT